MASPHVAGIVALMAQKNPGLTPEQAEMYLESAAIPMAAGSLVVGLPGGVTGTISWGDDAVGSGFITADAALAATPAP
jgi:subtilisin family serine protease